jgi:hypothetical protein
MLVLHNLIRWAVLLTGFWALINGCTGLFNRRPFSSKDNLSSLLFMISCDIQLLLGLLLMYSNNWFSKMTEMGSVMKDSYNRFFLVEHGFIMILAWILVHVGRTATKKAPDDKKHKRMVIYFGIAILLILISIPWPNKPNVGRALFPQF